MADPFTDLNPYSVRVTSTAKMRSPRESRLEHAKAPWQGQVRVKRRDASVLRLLVFNYIPMYFVVTAGLNLGSRRCSCKKSCLIRLSVFLGVYGVGTEYIV